MSFLLGGQNWENTNFFQIGKGCGGYQTSCFPLLYIVTVSPAVWIINQKKVGSVSFSCGLACQQV